MDGTVLIADDDRTIRTVLTQALTRAGCRVHATASLTTLMRWVDEGRGDLVISDIVMPDGNGLETLPKISDKRPELPVIIISAQNTIMTAIQASEANAYDYLPKPFDLPDLMKRCARALEARRQARTPRVAQPQVEELPLVGRTPAMQSLYRLVARVINTELPVLITGESGTGKSLIARAIHDNSDRRTMPFVVIGAETLEKSDGATAALAKARGGTVVLDEIADVPLETQGRLVRAIESLRDSAPRIMAITQQDLEARVENGDFRQDLFYRLNAVSIAVPSLRQRIDDIPLLAKHFLNRAERDIGELKGIAPEALDLMRKHTWPGNVRQLENAIRRLVVTCPESVIGVSDVEIVLGNQPAIEPAAGSVDAGKLSASVEAHLRRYFDLHGGVLPPPGLYARILREIEQPLIDIALEATGGNQAKCADLLGINRNTLRKKISELDIRVTRRRKLM